MEFLHIRGVGRGVEVPVRGQSDAGFEGYVAMRYVADYFIAAVALCKGYVDGRGLPAEFYVFDFECCGAGRGAAEEG